MARKPTHFKLNGRRYKYLPNSKTKYYGYCSDPNGPANKRFIAIGKKCKNDPHSELDTLIHEMLHALAPFEKEEWGSDKVEKWVHNTANDIANALWQLGYRKNLQHGETAEAPQEGDK